MRKNIAIVLGIALLCGTMPLFGQFRTDFTDSGEGLVTRGDYVLRGTTLVQYQGEAEHVNIPIDLGITEIGDEAFSYHGIKSITIPEGVWKIGRDAIYECYELTEVRIPASISHIERNFTACWNLANIAVDERNLSYSSVGGVLFNKNKTILIRYPRGKEGTTYTIPDSVIFIEDFAFYGCALSTITIPSSVTLIGDEAFSRSDIVSITIPAGVTMIGDGTFEGCRDLVSITLPSSITHIGVTAFYRCESLVSMTIPAGVTSIERWAFAGCSNLRNITIPAGVTSIDVRTFFNCTSLRSVTIPSSITSIGWEAFSFCSSLTSITIPASVTTIESGAFEYCSNLRNITIPTSVTSIGAGLFRGCTNLTYFSVDERNPAYTSEGGVLFNKDKTVLIQYPSGNQDSTYSIPAGVTRIETNAFDNKNLFNITIPPGVTRIGNYAFSDCIRLSSITFPSSVNYIDQYAINFSYGTQYNLKTIEVSRKTEIGYGAFPDGIEIRYSD